MKAIYMDYAAATPVDAQVLQAMLPYFSENFHNPSALYLSARAVAKQRESARASVAHWLGARPSEIIFTAGGTEANNLAIHGIMQQFPEANLVVSGIEHDSVLGPANKYSCRIAAVRADGITDTEAMRGLIDDETVLVSIMYANNEIGSIQPLKGIAELLSEVRSDRASRNIDTPIYFHTDACQAANYLHLNTAKLGVDMMTINSGKIYGPKQAGALYVRAGVILDPQIIGGGQERGLRSGTESMANIVGFAAALDTSQQARGAESERLHVLQAQFMKLLESKIPNAEISGSRKHRLPNNVHIRITGQDNERLMMSLDELGIQCATGSACSASSDEPSHVLRAIGCDDEAARSSLRFTMGRQTTAEHIHAVIDALKQVA